MERQIKIFDTTLRDGEQSPGCTMNLKEKIQMAKQLEKLNVDIIEAGFAAASDGDLNSIQEISKVINNAVVTSLARCNKSDIDKSWESLKYAKHPRIHVFIATSPVHMQYKLQMSPDEVLKNAGEMVSYAKSLCNDIEFSAEDATRSDVDFLAQIFTVAIKAGATTINIPDTVGYTTPDEYYDFITSIRNKCPLLDTVDISVHCHDDLGLAVANSLSAIKAGATQIECTINGIGERAGNASLEEIAMAIKTRKDRFNVYTGINTQQIMKTSQMLSHITGVNVQPNKAIVGKNAFAHESGIHQHGVLMNKQTYEIITPESVGLDTNSIVLGKHSGRHAFNDKLEKMGYSLTTEELNKAFEKFKELADKKKVVFDKDIEAIVAKEQLQIPKVFELQRFVINSGNSITSTASVAVKKDDTVIEEVSIGEGPVDASFKALDKIVGESFKLDDFSLNSITEGEDALGDAVVRIENEDKTYTGRGMSTDIIEASIIAYINAVNKLFYEKRVK